MDMLNILKNFENASSGKKATNAGGKSDMKAILESFNKASQPVEECGTMEMPMTSPSNSGTPVSMNISLNASGKDNVDELMALLKGAGLSNAAPVAQDKPEPMDMGAMRALVMSPDSDEEDEGDMEEEWDNSPGEEYSDHDTMTQDLSGGINRQKKQYKAAQPGDNAMAVESIKDKLWAALNEKKTTEGRGRGRGKKKMEDIKTTEGRGRGRGKKK